MSGTSLHSYDTEVVVIGASCAGLAMSACLARAEIPYLLLERTSRIADAWRRHYDRLHLHTHKAISALPYLDFPKSYPKYPSRDQVVSYLEAYASHFNVTPILDSEVEAATYEHGFWHSRVAGKTFRSKYLVVATGLTSEPNLPEIPGQAQFQGKILHSSQYKNGAEFKDRDVLVVGFGNSAGEIAIDLHEHGARSAIAVRSAVNIVPRDICGIPILSLMKPIISLPPPLVDFLSKPLLRATIGNISSLGLSAAPIGPVEQIISSGRIPLLDIGTVKLIRKGLLRVYPGITQFDASGLQFTSGEKHDFDAVVLATGYRANVSSFLKDDQALTTDGLPIKSGYETSPGLYFCGYYIAPTGMFGEIAIEAKRIVGHILSKLKT